MAGFAIQGWCPGAYRPMRSGDGLVVRIRVPGGRLSPEQAAGLARAARDHGDGQVELTARGHLQLRGVAECAHPALIARLRELGLLDPDPAAEARPAILLSPWWREGDGTCDLGSAIAEALGAAPPLPAKFGIAIESPAGNCLGSTSADIRLERGRGGGLILRPDGLQTGRAIAPDAAPGAVLALIRWFVDQGGVRDGRGRMAALIARGARPPGNFACAPAPAAPPPRPGPGPIGVHIGFAFGQIAAETLAALAGHGAGLRLTPWRMLVIEGQDTAPALPGAITADDDPRLRVSACTGAPGCPQAHGPTRDLARALAPQVPLGAHLHVSGCAKGCAHPGPAAVTLRATPTGFDLIAAGRAGDPATEAGLTAATLPERIATHFKAP